MRLKIDPRSAEWWAWTTTLVALVAGLAGFRFGFAAAIAISVAQCVWFATTRGAGGFPTQVRMVYLALTAIACFDPTRLFYGVLTLGTVMVVLFDRCLIARVLAMAPWNRGVALS